MLVLLILIVSVLIGLLLRRWHWIRFVERSSTWTVWLIIFVFGVSLGSNETITNDFSQFGITAFLVAIAGIAGSVSAGWIYSRYIGKRKKG